ncbi:MAG: hypothetical protein JXA04_03115 [Gammaproteobacteria bacterium]|nr:hypothetical protein [Gammaproteobacteria bacterium]
MNHKPHQSSNSEKSAWEQHNLDQLLYFRSLNLRQKLLVVEGMCDVSRRFQQMRMEGKFR